MSGNSQQNTPLHELSHIRAAGLKHGQKGREVASLQRYLSALGYLQPTDGAVPGEFDTATANALALFQGFYGLQQTEVLDQETANQMSIPRSCGVPDLLPPGTLGRKNPWPKTNLTFSFSNINGSSEINSPHKASAAFLTGYTLWEAITPIRFSWSADVTGADIVIHFASSPGCVPCGHVCADACTTWPEPNHPINHATSTFRDVIWQVENPTGYDMVAFAAHEVGHALGLWFPVNGRDYSHSPISTALMYFSIPAGRRKLERDDIDAAKRVYG